MATRCLDWSRRLPQPAGYQIAEAAPPSDPAEFFQQRPELPGGLMRGTTNLSRRYSPNSPAAARGYPFLIHLPTFYRRRHADGRWKTEGGTPGRKLQPDFELKMAEPPSP